MDLVWHLLPVPLLPYSLCVGHLGFHLYSDTCRNLFFSPYVRIDQVYKIGDLWGKIGAIQCMVSLHVPQLVYWNLLLAIKLDYSRCNMHVLKPHPSPNIATDR